MQDDVLIYFRYANQDGQFVKSILWLVTIFECVVNHAFCMSMFARPYSW